MSTIDFTRSELFRESNSDIDQFPQIFGHPHKIDINEDTLPFILHRCDFFMMKPIPFHELFPWRQFIRNLSIHSQLKNELIIAFFGKQKNVINSFNDELIKWVHQYRKPLRSTSYMDLLHNIDHKTEDSIIEIMECLWKLNILPKDREFIDFATRKKCIHISKWLWTHGCPLESIHIINVLDAMDKFDPSLIVDMIQNGCPIHSHTVASACSRGRLDFVEWWHSQGYPFCESAAAWAALWGHLHIIKFLIKHNKPINVSWTLSNARMSSHTKICSIINFI